VKVENSSGVTTLVLSRTRRTSAFMQTFERNEGGHFDLDILCQKYSVLISSGIPITGFSKIWKSTLHLIK